MKRVNLLISWVLAILVVAVGAMAQTPNKVSAGNIKQLVKDVHNAEFTRNIEKLANLLTDNFKETNIDGRGARTTLLKETFLDVLSEKDAPEAVKKVFSRIVFANKINNFSVRQSGAKANFKYKLTVRKSLKTVSENPPVEFKEIYRLKIVGTAVRRNGKWLLDFRQLTFIRPQNIEQAKKEITDGINFNMALVRLVVEAKKSEQKPN